MMKEPKVVKHGDHEYRVGRLDPFQQLHVARKLGPLLSKLELAFADPKNFNPMPIIQAMADLSQEDTDYIVKTCLSVCTRKTMTGAQDIWAPVQIRSGQLMFDDLTGGELLSLSVDVVMENLESFFSFAQQNSQSKT